jgi:UDP-MurNAc hydroxylase
VDDSGAANWIGTHTFSPISADRLATHDVTEPQIMAPTALRFQFIANACGVFIGSQGTRILCDPWLDDGVFDGSWCHYPKLKTTFTDVSDVDAIYISHLHPDHFDDRFFNYRRDIPIIVLDHGYNFLIKNLQAKGYSNLVRIPDAQTVSFREFNLTMFAPFAKHNFHDAEVGNLIDSALVIECDGVKALNANDNTVSIAASDVLRERFSVIDLAMLNYNAAGPYPSCFDNLSEYEKTAEHSRIIDRNIAHMADILRRLQPRAVLPFAGAYVLGGDLRCKNKYLGTITWDECARLLKELDIGNCEVKLLREGDTLDLETLESDRPYVPIDTSDMNEYITDTIAGRRYPYQLDPAPDALKLVEDARESSVRMLDRMARLKLKSDFNVYIRIFDALYKFYPSFEEVDLADVVAPSLSCSMDERLLRRILDRKSHWNNAEIGAHISFRRHPNRYEPDLHTALQFFHL